MRDRKKEGEVFRVVRASQHLSQCWAERKQKSIEQHESDGVRYLVSAVRDNRLDILHQGVWVKERPCWGHSWMGTLSKILSSRCRFQFLDNGIDRWQGEQPLPGTLHYLSLLPLSHPTVSIQTACYLTSCCDPFQSVIKPLNHLSRKF